MSPAISSIRFKLAAALGVPVLLVIIVGISSVFQLQRVHLMTLSLREDALPKQQALETMKQALTLHNLLSRRFIDTTDFRQLADMGRSMDAFNQDIDRARAVFAASGIDAYEARAVEDFATHLAAYRASFENVLRLNEQGNLFMAQRSYRDETQTVYGLAMTVLDDLIVRVEGQMLQLENNAQRVYAQSRLLTEVAIALALVAALATIWWVSRFFAQPLLSISGAMQRLTEGRDDGAELDLPERRDEIGILAAATHAYRDSMVQRQHLAQVVEVERDRLSAAIANMPVGLCMLDRQGRLVVCNRAFLTIYGLDEKDTRPGTSYLEIIRNIAGARAPNRKPVRAFLKGVIADLRRGELVSRRWSFADGQFVKVLVQPMRHGWVTMHEDVTERLTVEERIRHMARHDALTGLPNRTVFSERIGQVLDGSPVRISAAVMILDLDRFKSVNDTLGHPIGDQLLRAVAQRLKRIVPDRDVIARMGGDEFAIVLEAPDIRAVADRLAERLVKAVSKPYEISGHAVRIGLTIGIALALEDGHDAEELIKNADLALYDAKAAGKGTWRFFDHELDMNAQRRRRLELDLRAALAEGQIVPYFQPIVSVQTGKVAGFEALARWEHPQRGLLFPGEFIAVAEEAGLITELGEAILDLACKAAVEWPTRIRLSVNLSPQQFTAGSLADRVAEIVGKAGFDPRRLDLEITENVLLHDTEETIAAMHELRNLGAAIAIDDFGVGYSSLSYLLRFPFDKLKLDASFIRTLESHGSAHAIMRSVAVLGSSLCVRTTAEGVENRRQFHALRVEGITEAQGFLFGRAVPFDETEQLIETIEKAGLTAA